MTARTILSDPDLESPLLGKAVTAHIKSRVPEGFTCTVYDAGTGRAHDALLPRSVAHELSAGAAPPVPASGDTVIALVVGVSDERELMLSVTSHELVERLLTGFVEEILNGKVAIRAIARAAGTRTKIAVAPTAPGVDARRACVGPGATRVKGVEGLLNRALGSETLEIVEHSDDRAAFLTNAMMPVEVADLLVEGEHAVVVVEPDRLSGDIRERSLNARLAGQLTGLSVQVVAPDTDLRTAMDRLAAGKT